MMKIYGLGSDQGFMAFEKSLYLELQAVFRMLFRVWNLPAQLARKIWVFLDIQYARYLWNWFGGDASQKKP